MIKKALGLLVVVIMISHGYGYGGSTGLGTDPFTSGGQFTKDNANAMNNAINDNASDITTINTHVSNAGTIYTLNQGTMTDGYHCTYDLASNAIVCNSTGVGTISTTGVVNADEISVFSDATTLKALTESEFKTAYNMVAGTDYQTVISFGAGSEAALGAAPDTAGGYASYSGLATSVPANETDPTVDTDDEIIAIINASPSTQIGVPAGGSGAGTFTDGGLLVGAGTGPFEALPVGLTTEIMVGGGAGTNPAWSTDLPTAVTIGSGYIYRAGGTDVPDADVADDITASNYVPLATYDAQTVLAAVVDDTPAAITLAEQTVLGRVTGGDIGALTLGNTASSVAQWPPDPAAHTLFGFDNTGNIYRPILIGSGLSYDQPTNTISASASATAFDDIAAPDAALSLNLGAYQHLLDTNVDTSAFRVGLDASYFEVVNSGGTDVIVRLVGSNITAQLGTFTVASDSTHMRGGTTADDDWYQDIYDVDGTAYVHMLTGKAGNEPYLYLGPQANGWRVDQTGAMTPQGTASIQVPSGNVVADSFCVAISDETTDLTTGAAKVTFRMPYAMTLDSDGLRASVNTAPVGSTIIIDVNEGGATIMTTNKLSIDASEKTSTTAATAAGITDTALADDAEMTIDIDQIGSGTAGKGAKVCFRGTRSW